MLRKSQYQDLTKYHHTKRLQERRYHEKTGCGQYPRRRWTVEEEHRVLDHTISDRELSKEIHRSLNAIQMKRNRLMAKLKHSI